MPSFSAPLACLHALIATTAAETAKIPKGGSDAGVPIAAPARLAGITTRQGEPASSDDARARHRG